MQNRNSVGMALAAALLACAGCGGRDVGSESNLVAGTTGNETTAAPTIPDSCTFFAKGDLETALGRQLRDGDPQSVPEGAGSSCVFKKQLGRDATRTFAVPALPAAVAFGSVTISTSPADPEAVAQIRRLDPAAFDDVPGLGDDAYFLGPNLLHVRVGNRSFSARIDPEARSPEEQAELRKVLVSLGRQGVSRL